MAEERSPSKSKKIMELKEGEQDVTVVARVLETEEPKVISTKKGPRTISEAVVGDETGKVRVTLWGEKAGSLEEGDVVKIEKAWTTSFKGKVQLNVGARSTVEKLDDSAAPAAEDVPDREPAASSRPPREGGGPRFRGPRRGPRFR